MANTGRSHDSTEAKVFLLAYADAHESVRLVRRLAGAGFHDIVTCPLAQASREFIESLQPDLILLESSTTADELLASCESMRSFTALPVVVLSKLTGQLTIIDALQAGIDDYLVLPMNDQEFIARLRALSRRFRSQGTGSNLLAFGGFELFPHDHSVSVAGRVVDLTPIEFRLLECLVAAQGNVVTHDSIMANVWGAEYVDSRQYLHLYIRYLRDKLEEDRRKPKQIISEWGIGYRLQAIPAA